MRSLPVALFIELRLVSVLVIFVVTCAINLHCRQCAGYLYLQTDTNVNTVNKLWMCHLYFEPFAVVMDAKSTDDEALYCSL